MTEPFCIDVIALPARLRADRGVLRAGTIAVTADAQRAARGVIEQARIEADGLLEKARDQAASIVELEKQHVAVEAGALLNGLRAMRETLFDDLAPLAMELAARAFACLVAETTPEERVTAAMRRVREEAPERLISAVAWVHPDDLPLIDTAPWELRADARLARGSCRLEASTGEWRADFGMGVAALEKALGQ